VTFCVFGGVFGVKNPTALCLQRALPILIGWKANEMLPQCWELDDCSPSWNIRRSELSQLIVISFTNSYFGWTNTTEVRQLTTPVEYPQSPDGLVGIIIPGWHWSLHPAGTEFVCLDVYILQVQTSSVLMFTSCRYKVRLPWSLHPPGTKFVCLDVYILQVQSSSALMFTSCRYKVLLP
jgi:hypothetical protein